MFVALAIVALVLGVVEEAMSRLRSLCGYGIIALALALLLGPVFNVHGG